MTNTRHGKGTIEWVRYRDGGGCWHAKISVPGQPRTRVKLSDKAGRFLTDFEDDRELARDLAEKMSKRARASELERQSVKLAPKMTVAQFGKMWTSGKLYELHGEVRGLKPKKSAKSDETRLDAHVYPYIGTLPVATVEEPDVERALAKAARAAEKKLGRPWRQASKFQVYQVMHRLFDLAIKPGRLRTTNPVSVDLRPSKGSPKLYSFLYPDELLAMLGCTDVPLVRRVHYALATYTGLRKGSLKPLTCGSLDFDHDTIVSLDSKTGLPQIFAQTDPELAGIRSLMIVLKRWLEYRGDPSASAPLIGALECDEGREAETLRADLEAAGVKRQMLFTRSAQIEPLRFHDCRASFVTWARRAGKGRGWIADRTGHLTEEMIKRYDRGARQLADLQYEPFPDLSTAIPELSKDAPKVARLHRPRGSK